MITFRLIIAYEKDTAAATDKYAHTEGGEFTPPTAAGVDTYIVMYEREVESGVAITNKADKFPQTVKLTLKALAVDPCHSDVLKGVYIVLPSFQVSPEIEISLTTDISQSFILSAASLAVMFSALYSVNVLKIVLQLSLQ